MLRVEQVQPGSPTHPVAKISAWVIASAFADVKAEAPPFEEETVTGAPLILREAVAASRILTIPSP